MLSNGKLSVGENVSASDFDMLVGMLYITEIMKEVIKHCR